MQVTLDSREAAYVARQPILDASGKVFGYELLYRAAADDTSCDEARDVAGARVLNDATLGLGLATLTGGTPAFVNVTRHMLLSDLATLFPPAGVVLEILEDVVADAEVLSVCRALRARGYVLALDDFTLGSSAEALMPYASFVKVDVLATSREERRQIARALPRGVTLIAEKVESFEVFEESRTWGATLFQGYHFCRPKTFAAGAVSTRQLAYAKVMAALIRPDLSVHQLEELIKREASLSLRILRCVNSGAFGLRREITSIGHALVLLGLDHVRRWALVWAMAGANGGAPKELVTVAVLRARSCELIGGEVGGQEAAAELFLLGLCSVLDAMIGKPMREALVDFPLSSGVRNALLGAENDCRAVLDAVIAYERGQWDAARAHAARIGVAADRLPRAYDDALRWACELSQTAA